ncbi:MAG: ATP-binding protein [Spirochaetes bacterium]|nr:ATP-binding protein [Spirochaetota bacterium]
MPRFALVEHEALIALDIMKTLQNAGYGKIEVFDDGSSYLAAFPGRSFSLALIDLDVQGPVTGLDAAFATQAGGGPGIILIDSLRDEGTLQAAKKAGPLGILSKPFSRRELLGVFEIGLYRAQMESKLSRSEKRYRNLFDSSLSPRCIADLRGPGSPIVQRNAAFERLFGTKERFSDLFADEKHWKEIAAAIESGRTVGGIEIPMNGKGGECLQIIGSFSEMTEPSEGGKFVSAELFDITEPRKLRDELQQAQKMEALGRLSGGIAHDFNNILTAIRGHAELLALETKKDSDAFQDIEGILRTTEKASNLSRQLLRFSRKQPYAPRLFDLGNLMRENAFLLKKLAGDGIIFTLSVPEGSFPILADPAQIEQVLVNLVVNARDAVDGKIDPFIYVALGAEPIGTGKITGGKILPEGDYFRIEVSDNGSGMPPAVAAQVFKPFFTTKAIGKGTGFGLSTVADIAERLGGAVEVTSSLGKGSAFWFWLPAGGLPYSAETERISPTRETGIPAMEDFRIEGQTDLLVVDADESVLGFISYALARAGALVTPARNSGEALIYSENKRFKGFIIDVDLPGIDGLILYSRLAGKGAEKLPCVFTSGKGWPSDHEKPKGTLWLEKPYSPAALVVAVNSVLAAQARTDL